MLRYIFCVICVFLVCPAYGDHEGDDNEIQVESPNRRPLYNIAHMCNSIESTLTALRRGANAVEVDVTFRPNDIHLYHGYPCDCFRYCWNRELLSKYLTFARRITTPNMKGYDTRFVILYFDVKLTNFNAAEKAFQGKRFADYMERYFFNDDHNGAQRSTLRFVVSISYAADVDFLRSFIQRFRELNLEDRTKDQIGFDVGMDRNLDNIRTMWKQLNVSNVWQGEGITNCINPVVDPQLKRLTQERDMSDGYMQKVYRWTIDLSDALREAIRSGTDGVMTNHPERVVEIVRETEFMRSVRLATIRDNPYVKYTSKEKTHLAAGTVRKNPLERMLTLFRDLRQSFYYFVVDVINSLNGAK